MIFCKFLIFLFITKDAFCYHGLKRIMNNKLDGEKELGYFLKSADGDDNHNKSKQESVVRDRVKIEDNQGGLVEDDTTRRTVLIIVEPTRTVKDGLLKDVPLDGPKPIPDEALPLHVTNTARQQCLEGYQPDENGICQKTMQPKNDKSFKLRRRKRAEQAAPKLSYADVVKYGRNPPKELLTTMKAELLTKKPEVIKVPQTTPPIPVTNRPKSSDLSKTSVKDVVTTVRVAPVTQKPVILASPTTIKSVAPEKVAPNTAKPSTVVTVPPVVKKFTNKPSVVGDINQAFLFGEKSSVVSQSMDGKVKPVVTPVAAKKTVDATRLRRWIRFL